MKKQNIVLIISLILLSTVSKAQITLEATYDSSYASVYVVNLEQAGEKFIRLDQDSAKRQIRLYNLNHSLWKTINLNAMPVSKYVDPFYDTTYFYNYDVLYVTQHLFNLDNNVELMFV